MNHALNCLSHWYRKIEGNPAIPTPKTVILPASQELLRDSLHAGKANLHFDKLVERIREAVPQVGGYPAFLRTGQTSGKHDWKRTCFLTDADTVPHHVGGLIEFSEMAGFPFTLPYDTWCVREMLPVKPLAVLPAYGGMPLVKEVRCFVHDAHVLCAHPYWPMKAILQGMRCTHREKPRNPAEWLLEDQAPKTIDPSAERKERERGCAQCDYLASQVYQLADPTNDADRAEWGPLAERVAAVFHGEGSWSVDLLKTTRGWFLTDMATASESFHFEGCPVAANYPRESP